MTRKDFIALALLDGEWTDECILWPYAIRNSGYGAHCAQIQGIKKNYDVHRYVCEKAHGVAPSTEHEAAHSCGTKLCINRQHLLWKMPEANMRDAIEHGTLRGGGRYRQRIFDYDRAVIQASKEPYSVLAAQYGTDVAYIGKLRRLPLQYDL